MRKDFKPKQHAPSDLVTMLMLVTKERAKKLGEALNRTRIGHSFVTNKEEEPK